MFNNLVLKRFFLFLFFVMGGLLWSQGYALTRQVGEVATEYVTLTANRLTSGTLSSVNNYSQKAYLYTIPANSMGVKITMFNQKTKLRLCAGYDYDVDTNTVRGKTKEAVSSQSDMQSITSLVLHRFNDPDYQEGTLFIKVALAEAEDLFDLENISSNQDVAQTVSFMIKVEQIAMPSAILLNSGKSYSFNLNGASQFVVLYKIDITNEKQPIIFNWKSQEGAALLFVKQGKAVFDSSSADYYFDLNNIEQEFIMGTQDVPLSRGTIYITIVSEDKREVKGTISANVIKHGNVTLKPLSSLPQKRGNDYENCMSALVGVTTAYGSCCGAFVSSKGHILTSLSAVQDPSGRLVNDISVLLSISSQEEPIYAFKAKVLKSYPDGDLALLALTTMAMDKAIPAGMKFPFVPIATGMNIEVGQPILLCGFPFDKLRGRVSPPFVMQNIVGGFEKRGSAMLFKSVAIPGGMGSIVFNIYFELIGVTSSQNKTAAEITTLFSSTKVIPPDWHILLEG